ncbi:MAG TPA: sigma-54 dependent transcriptional regulator [Myxococcales bacterium]|nr:sigma-54 dependent transcriptional regulator [Myxococcales bacterium]
MIVTSEAGIKVESPARIAWCEPEEEEPERLLVSFELVSGPDPAAEDWRALVASLKPVVLVVDDDATHVASVRGALERRYRVISCASAEEALALMDREEVSVLLADQRLPDVSGTAFLRELSRRFPRAHASRLIASAHTKAEDVQDLINLGRIFHYLRKPVLAGELLQAVDRGAALHALAVENERLARELQHANRRLRRENASLKRRLSSAERTPAMIGNSPSFLRAVRHLEEVGSSDCPVHIVGETGTGKELVARAIHLASERADRPFVAQNCAALPDTLIQSALFGHARGAFTGADRNQPGLFQAAHGGTLFLDEVAELSLPAQAALLRVLQDGEVLPVGSPRPIRVDVRILSATHRNLRAEVSAGRFREDLYFRLVVVLLTIPPLRERPSDIALLANHFLRAFSERMAKPLTAFTSDALRALEHYPWPGNVRELRNEIERAVVLGRPHEPLAADLLSEHIRSLLQSAPMPGPANSREELPRYDEALRALERNLVEQALARSSGVVSRAAEALGMERTRLTKLRQRLGIA